MSHKTPRTAARQSVFKTEAGTYRILSLVESATIILKAPCLNDNAEHLLQQVELMGSQVVEVAATCNIGLQTPREIPTLIVQLTWRNGKAYLNIHGLADDTTVQDVLYLEEIRQQPTIISHETGNARLFRDAVDACTVVIRRCQRFLHIDRLTLGMP